MQFTATALTLLALSPTILAGNLDGKVDKLDYHSGFSIGPAVGSTDTSVPYKYYSTDTAEFDSVCIEVGDGGPHAKALRVQVFQGVRLVWTNGPDGEKCTCDTKCGSHDGPYTIDDLSAYNTRYLWAIRAPT